MKRRRRIPRPPLSIWGYAVRHTFTSTLLAELAALGLLWTLDAGNYVVALAMFGRFDAALVGLGFAS